MQLSVWSVTASIMTLPCILALHLKLRLPQLHHTMAGREKRTTPSKQLLTETALKFEAQDKLAGRAPRFVLRKYIAKVNQTKLLRPTSS